MSGNFRWMNQGVLEEQYMNMMRRLQTAEQLELQNKILQQGLKPTEQEMERIRELAAIIGSTGNADALIIGIVGVFAGRQFVSASAVLCSCWWCRIKRFVQERTKA